MWNYQHVALRGAKQSVGNTADEEPFEKEPAARSDSQQFRSFEYSSTARIAAAGGSLRTITRVLSNGRPASAIIACSRCLARSWELR